MIQTRKVGTLTLRCENEESLLGPEQVAGSQRLEHQGFEWQHQSNCRGVIVIGINLLLPSFLGVFVLNPEFGAGAKLPQT